MILTTNLIGPKGSYCMLEIGYSYMYMHPIHQTPCFYSIPSLCFYILGLLILGTYLSTLFHLGALTK